jgi:hypothetical protein
MSEPNTDGRGLSDREIADQQATDLPDREAMSLLDVVADLNLDLNLAAPIDAGVAANANAAAPIDAGVSANLLSVNSETLASTGQQSVIQQSLHGDASASATQDAGIDQGSTGN